MTTFEVHTIDSAPAGSVPALTLAKRVHGSIPNLFGVFAESPATLKAYTQLQSILESSVAFDPTELQVVLLTTSFENECDYCMAAHTATGASRDRRGLASSRRDPEHRVDLVEEFLRA